MPTVAETYAELAGQLLDRIRATPADRWDAVSPCRGWTARDVVAHVINGHRGILAFVTGRPPVAADGVGVSGMDGTPAVEPGADLAVAFARCRDDMVAMLRDPELAARTVPGPMGVVPVERAVDVIGSLEVLVHTWDLARAVGGDERLDEHAVIRTHEALLPHYEGLQATGAFDPSVPAPAGADPQTAFLCFAGRASAVPDRR